MARKCKFCKDEIPKVKECTTFYEAKGYSSIECMAQHGLEKARKAKEKADKRAHTERKRKFYDNDLKKQHELTQKSFNKMRVLEEKLWFKQKGVEPYCISCKKENMDWCCGHYKTRGSSSYLRYDRKNTFLQCNRYCNMGKSGNIEGCKDTIGYKAGLVDRFGDYGSVVIDYCQSNQATIKKWTCEELITMRKEFNLIIKEIANELES